MKNNMGAPDRMLRPFVAVMIAILYFTDVITGTVGILLLFLAAIFAVTGPISVRPLYLPFGLSTRRS